MGTMMRQTSMAMGINASALCEYQDRYDRACKRLLSHDRTRKAACERLLSFRKDWT